MVSQKKSLMLASGYLKVISSDALTGDRTKAVMYNLALTNFEIKLMFENMILRWFSPAKMETNEKYSGIVIEFKVINPRKENTLEETVASALKQIEEKTMMLS